jgi:patatin-like phospholipase/acyl hydrolase
MAYRILSLDGGGIRGVFTTTVLERLAGAVPGFLGRVDLFAGTSTGGIIALGLAAGLAPADLTRLYLRHGDEIFPDTHLGWLKDATKLVCAEYDNASLERLLEEVFAPLGVVTLGDLEPRVLVPTFDLDSGDDPGRAPGAPRTWKPKFFHNYPGPTGDRDARIVDVLLRTTAGPTYFPTWDGFVDGGVIANNPSMAALAQAVNPGTGARALEEVCLLSVGTGQRLRFVKGKVHDWGYVQWAKPLLQILTEAAMDTTRYECRQILGGRFCRVDAVLDREMDLDDVADAEALVEQARALPLDDAVTWVGRHFG